jgi:hypothetical protein
MHSEQNHYVANLPALGTRLAIFVLENLAHGGHGSLIDILIPAGKTGKIAILTACRLDILDILRQ